MRAHWQELRQGHPHNSPLVVLSPRWRWLCLLLLALAVGEFLWRGPVRFLYEGYGWSDISQVYVPARAWWQGLNPYDPQTFVAVCRSATGGSPSADDIRTHSPYPLTTLVVAAPLAVLQWPTAHLAWTVVLVLASLISVTALALLARLADVEHAILFAAGALALAPLHTGIAVGNVSMVAIALCCAGVWAAADARHVLSGVCVGLATCLKPQLGVCLLLYYLLRRQWRIFGIAMVVGAAALAVGVVRLEISGAHWLPDFLRNARGFAADNQTVDFTENDPIRFTLINLQVLFFSLSGNASLARYTALCGGGLLFTTWLYLNLRSRWNSTELLAVGSLLVLSLLPAYHRNYDATLLMFPLAWALGRLDERMKSIKRWILVLMIPFAIPGPALLQRWMDAERIPAGVAQSWWWNSFVMPHEIWALIAISALLLRALSIDQGRASRLPGTLEAAEVEN